MTLRKTALAASALGAGALLALAAPLSASAHVTVSPSGTAAGSYTVLSFAFGHGCDGSPTTALTFDLPDGIESATPTLNPNWTIEKAERQIVYTAITPVEDGFRDTVELSLRLPDDAAGQTLAFPVLQSCVEGETNWSDPDPAANTPAPSITVTEASGGGHGNEETATDAAGEPAAGDDVLARVLGIGGLVVGAVGVVLALTSRRKAS